MALVSGTNGSLSYSSGGYATAINGWSLDIGIADLDVTSWDDATSGVIWRERIAGIREFSGTISAVLDPTQDALASIGTALTATFTVDTEQGAAGVGFSGDIIVTGINPSTDVNSAATVSFSFVGQGALAATTT